MKLTLQIVHSDSILITLPLINLWRHNRRQFNGSS